MIEKTYFIQSRDSKIFQMDDSTKITNNKGSLKQKQPKTLETELSEKMSDTLAKLSNKSQKKALLRALLLRSGKSYPLLGSDDVSEEHSKKVAELFLELMNSKAVQIQCMLNKANKYGFKGAIGLDGKPIKFSAEDTIFFPKPGTDLNPPTIGDLLHIKKGIVKSYEIFKPELGCSIDPDLMKAQAKFVSIPKEKSGLLGKLQSLLEKYRMTNVDSDKINAAKGSVDITNALGEDKATIVELIPDGNGGYKLDLAGLGEGVVKIAHLGEDGKPNGEFDVLVLDKQGRIRDGMITDGSSLGMETREELRNAIFAKETKGLDPTSPDYEEKVTTAINHSRQAAGLLPIGSDEWLQELTKSTKDKHSKDVDQKVADQTQSENNQIESASVIAIHNDTGGTISASPILQEQNAPQHSVAHIVGTPAPEHAQYTDASSPAAGSHAPAHVQESGNRASENVISDVTQAPAAEEVRSAVETHNPVGATAVRREAPEQPRTNNSVSSASSEVDAMSESVRAIILSRSGPSAQVADNIRHALERQNPIVSDTSSPTTIPHRDTGKSTKQTGKFMV